MILSWLFRKFKNKKFPFCEWESLIMDIIGLSLKYNSCNFSQVRRLANGCAHNIAKISCELWDKIIWRNSLSPSFCNPDVDS